MRQKTVKINGVEYKLQSIPYRSYLDIVDNSTNERGVLMKSAYADELFKHCVVNPKVKLEDFDNDYSSGYELMNEVETFLGSRGEPEETKEESTE
ncbi:hypothetical protein KQI38_07715 [Tissierella carlieri]|uniref:hypothetical protein n=1 Tax=Tissierella carlieri TaxID=689904 RepID=UPI001C12815E|nr:hypothetical protein [Tissierella carlieri]MBU5311914.1 hypothetical protein [Tissierella carlieri]